MNFQDELELTNKILMIGIKAGQEIERCHDVYRLLHDMALALDHLIESLRSSSPAIDDARTLHKAREVLERYRARFAPKLESSEAV